MGLPPQILLLGVLSGALAGINSLGFVLLWRTTRVVNLAQPSMGLAGGVLTAMLVGSSGWSFWWAAPIGIAFGTVMGLMVDRLVMFRLVDMPRTVLLVATVGLAQIFGAMKVAMPFIFGGQRGLPNMSFDLGFQMQIGNMLLRGPDLLTLALFPLIVVGLWWFLHRTRMGIAAGAHGQDTERARSLGVAAHVIRAIVWALAGTLSGVAGVLAVPVLGFNVGAGISSTVLLLALTPAVLAGLRSIWGTALTAVAIGVVYNAVLFWIPQNGRANLVLVGLVVAGIALRRRRFGREEGSGKSATFAAAVSPRPLPWSLTRRRSYRVATVALTLAVAAAVAVPPLLIAPSSRVLYAASTAFALASIAVAVAWMFAGEVALGHWGLAGFGAVVAVVMPGPAPVRVLAAIVVAGLSGVVLAFSARRQSGLAFAVVGLAAAVAAPVLVTWLGQRPVDTNVAAVGSIGAALAVFAAAGVARLRGSRLGVRMVAGRDDPMRAPFLGANPFLGRLIGLAVSGALAGLAGAVYVLSLPSGLTLTAFDTSRSLDVLGMAIIGGMGTPVGALVGAAAMRGAEFLLPGAWASLASGAGIVLVVMFMPAGLGRWVESARNLAVRVLFGVDMQRRGEAAAEAAAEAVEERLEEIAPDVPDDDVALVLDRPRTARIAGADTREALHTPSVRAAMTAAGLLGGPGLVAVLGGASAVGSTFGLRAGAAPFLTLMLVAAAIGSALLVWRSRRRHTFQDIPLEIIALGALTVVAAYVAATGDRPFGVGALPLAIVTLFAIIGDLIHRATTAVVSDVQSAAAGLVMLAVGAGAVGALHLALVSGSGLPRVAGWSTAYLLIGARWAARARRLAPIDARNAYARSREELVVRDVPALEEVGEPVLRLSGITVAFGGARVLDGVDLDAHAGQVVALVGGNGAGKSTLLRVAAGFETASAGKVALLGEDITGLRPEERSQTGVAFVSGSRPVFPELTVMENLRVGAFRTHHTRASFQAATEAVLELVPAVARRTGTRAALLSGGEQRLLAIAQTLYRRPALLIADEVTLGLDVEARHAVLDVLRSLADDGVAVIAVDHDLPALLPRSDRAILLSAGSSREFTDPSQLLAERADLLPATFLAKAIA